MSIRTLLPSEGTRTSARALSNRVRSLSSLHHKNGSEHCAIRVRIVKRGYNNGVAMFHDERPIVTGSSVSDILVFLFSEILDRFILLF